jgi:hypothetical protein
MIHNNTINRSQITSLPRFDDRNSTNRVGSNKEVDELRKVVKSSQRIIVQPFQFYIYQFYRKIMNWPFAL